MEGASADLITHSTRYMWRGKGGLDTLAQSIIGGYGWYKQTPHESITDISINL